MKIQRIRDLDGNIYELRRNRIYDKPYKRWILRKALLSAIQAACGKYVWLHGDNLLVFCSLTALIRIGCVSFGPHSTKRIIRWAKGASR